MALSRTSVLRHGLLPPDSRSATPVWLRRAEQPCGGGLWETGTAGEHCGTRPLLSLGKEGQ